MHVAFIKWKVSYHSWLSLEWFRPDVSVNVREIPFDVYCKFARSELDY